MPRERDEDGRYKPTHRQAHGERVVAKSTPSGKPLKVADPVSESLKAQQEAQERRRQADEAAAGVPEPSKAKPVAQSQGKKEVHIIHHCDTDGRAGAAIALSQHPGAYTHELQYGDPLPATPETSHLVFVDFSPPGSDMFELVNNSARLITWFDHHVSALEALKPLGFASLPGLRDTKHCGALLAFKHYYPERPIPVALDYIDRWDLWTHNEDPDVLQFIAGLKAFDDSPTSVIWPSLLGESKKPEYLAKVMDAGEVIQTTEAKRWAEHCKRGFECRFRHLRYGKYKCFALNTAERGSKVFATAGGYDLYIVFAHNGKHYVVNMYAPSPNTEALEIARTYGGGGHLQACGFVCEKLPLTTDPEFKGHRDESPAATEKIESFVGAGA